MSILRLQEQLQRQVGSIVERVCVEFWLGTPNTLASPISVGIKFRMGPSLILSCASDGGVAIRKGRLGLEPANENLRQRRIDQFSGNVVQSVELRKDRVVVSTSNHRIQILNIDDELEITVNGCDVKEVV